MLSFHNDPAIKAKYLAGVRMTEINAAWEQAQRELT
jgi:hypothetical protein